MSQRKHYWFKMLWAFSSSLAWAEELKPSLALQNNSFAEVLIGIGSFFILAAGIGMLRFPDFYTRLHASSKLVTLGGLGIFSGTALIFGSAVISERLLLIAAFFFLTTPLSSYMIARAGYLRGLKPKQEESSQDEWQACGSSKISER